VGLSPTTSDISTLQSARHYTGLSRAALRKPAQACCQPGCQHETCRCTPATCSATTDAPTKFPQLKKTVNIDGSDVEVRARMGWVDEIPYYKASSALR
jgi:hypothetical protein